MVLAVSAPAWAAHVLRRDVGMGMTEICTIERAAPTASFDVLPCVSPTITQGPGQGSTFPLMVSAIAEDGNGRLVAVGFAEPVGPGLFDISQGGAAKPIIVSGFSFPFGDAIRGVTFDEAGNLWLFGKFPEGPTGLVQLVPETGAGGGGGSGGAGGQGGTPGGGSGNGAGGDAGAGGDVGTGGDAGAGAGGASGTGGGGPAAFSFKRGIEVRLGDPPASSEELVTGDVTALPDGRLFIVAGFEQTTPSFVRTNRFYDYCGGPTATPRGEESVEQRPDLIDGAAPLSDNGAFAGVLLARLAGESSSRSDLLSVAIPLDAKFSFAPLFLTNATFSVEYRDLSGILSLDSDGDGLTDAREGRSAALINGFCGARATFPGATKPDFLDPDIDRNCELDGNQPRIVDGDTRFVSIDAACREPGSDPAGNGLDDGYICYPTSFARKCGEGCHVGVLGSLCRTDSECVKDNLGPGRDGCQKIVGQGGGGAGGQAGQGGAGQSGQGGAGQSGQGGAGQSGQGGAGQSGQGGAGQSGQGGAGQAGQGGAGQAGQGGAGQAGRGGAGQAGQGGAGQSGQGGAGQSGQGGAGQGGAGARSGIGISEGAGGTDNGRARVGTSSSERETGIGIESGGAGCAIGEARPADKAGSGAVAAILALVGARLRRGRRSRE